MPRTELDLPLTTTTTTSTQTLTILRNLNYDVRPPDSNVRPDRVRPYHQRLKNYQEKRAKIFCESIHTILRNSSRKIARSAERIKTYWSRVRKIRKRLRKSVFALEELKSDCRPFIKIRLLGEDVFALLDSGASITCIGSQAAKNFIESGEKYHPLNECVKTAGGGEHRIVGYIEEEIEFRGIARKMTIYIIPDLCQNCYLGADFFSEFGLLEKILESFCVESDPVQGCPEMHKLSSEEQNRLRSIISLFPSYEEEGLGRTKLLTHNIELYPDTRPIKQRYFSVSPAVERKLHSEIDRMLELRVIELAPPNCSWSSPVAMVEREGKVRLCLDSRKLNGVTVKDAYPLPKIDGILSRLPKARYISSLDLKHAFWQIELEESCRNYTAFTVPNRPLYRYVVMPFGLTNAPMTLCRLMDLVIPPQLREMVFVYLDDLLLISETFEDHLQLLARVAQLLRGSGLTVNISKCKFFMREVKYLGYIIGEGVMKPDPSKVSAILDMHPPRTVRELRRFLGIVGWYRRFVDNYASLTAPLTDLTSKRRQFIWNEEAQTSFDDIKKVLTTAPLLVTPDFTRPFVVQCDASTSGVGGVLSQEDEEGIERPIAYFSHKLNRAQRNYSITELECLAAVLCIQKFRGYIEGHPFKVVTDHASLRWLMRQTDLNGRLARWSLKLQSFEFSIEHRRGSLNVVPDALSRLEQIDAMEFEPAPIIDLKSQYFNSPEYEKLRRNIEENADMFPDIRIVDNLVYRRVAFANGDPLAESLSWKLWVPSELTAEVIGNAHCPPLASHCGMSKTIEKIRRNLYWPRMSSQIKDFIANCEVCKETKSPNIILRPPMGAQSKSSRPFQKLYMDLLGPYPRSTRGNIGLFIVVDNLSKFPLLKPLRKSSASNIVDYLENNVFTVFGVPETIVTDNGPQFRSVVFRNLLSRYGITHIFTAVYSPQANASERVNRSVIAAIRSYLDKDQKNWDRNIGMISAALRCAIHGSIGFSPYYVLFGQQMLLHGGDYELCRRIGQIEEGEEIDRSDGMQIVRQTVQKNLREAYESCRTRYNLRARPLDLKPGDVVFRRNFVLSNKASGFNAKLAPKFVKSTVVKGIGNCYYELKDSETGNTAVFHGKDIQRYRSQA